LSDGQEKLVTNKGIAKLSCFDMILDKKFSLTAEMNVRENWNKLMTEWDRITSHHTG
jgi:hypothetical protein